MGRLVIPGTSDVVSINGLPEWVRGPEVGNSPSASPNPYVAKRTSWFDPRDTEIAKLNRLLEEAHDEIRKAHNLLDARRDAGRERDVALYERDIAIRALAEVIQHFINEPAPAGPVEDESPAVRAMRVMQNIGAAR